MLVSAMIGAGLAAGTANAAPYVPGDAVVTVGTSCPEVGGSMAVKGTGFGDGESIALYLRAPREHLRAVTADDDGALATTVRLPSDATGARTIVATGRSSGRTAAAKLTIGDCADHPEGGGPELPRSGAVAVVGIGVIGIALLGGGVAVTVGNRRRRAADSDIS